MPSLLIDIPVSRCDCGSEGKKTGGRKVEMLRIVWAWIIYTWLGGRGVWQKQPSRLIIRLIKESCLLLCKLKTAFLASSSSTPRWFCLAACLQPNRTLPDPLWLWPSRPSPPPLSRTGKVSATSSLLLVSSALLHPSESQRRNSVITRSREIVTAGKYVCCLGLLCWILMSYQTLWEEKLSLIPVRVICTTGKWKVRQPGSQKAILWSWQTLTY